MVCNYDYNNCCSRENGISKTCRIVIRSAFCLQWFKCMAKEKRIIIKNKPPELFGGLSLNYHFSVCCTICKEFGNFQL